MYERTYMYRLYPNAAEKKRFSTVSDTIRALYNIMLSDRTEYFRENGVWKRLDPAPFVKASLLMRDLDPSVIDHTIKRLNQAYLNFFQQKKKNASYYRQESIQKAAEDPNYQLMDNDLHGYPQLKTKSNKESWDIDPENITVTPDRVLIPGVGNMKWKLHRPIPENALIRYFTILKKPSDHFYLLVHLQIPETFERIESPQGVLGIALEPGRLAHRSDGLPVFFHRQSEGQEARIQKVYEDLCRKTPGSLQYEKRRRYLAGLYEKRVNQRRDSLHKTAKAIVESTDCIALEEPAVMKKREQLMRRGVFDEVTDEAWWQFSEYLRYKSYENGVWFWKIPVSIPVRSACSVCGIITEKPTNQDNWECPYCGVKLPAAINTARNLELLGRFYNEEEKELNQQAE